MIVHMDSASPPEARIAGNQSDLSGGFKTRFGLFTKTLAENVWPPAAGRDSRSHRHPPRGYGSHL